MKFLEIIWLSSGTYGIVKVQTDYDGIKYYGGKTKDGNTEDEDIQHIMKWGSTIDPNVLTEFLSE